MGRDKRVGPFEVTIKITEQRSRIHGTIIFCRGRSYAKGREFGWKDEVPTL